MHKLKSFLVAIAIMTALCGQALAVNPDEVLDDPILEQRARDLSVEIRCLVCQNQSIDDSDAQLARDLRVLVREKLVEGLSDEEILEFLVKRYGEFVLLKPRLNAGTVFLWVAPFGFLVIAGAFLIFRKSRSSSSREKAAPLTEEERASLEKMLQD